MSTMSRITDKLINAGVIVEKEDEEATGRGRKKIFLKINGALLKAIGIQLGRDFIKIILMDFNSKIYGEKDVKVSTDPGLKIEEIIDKMAELLREYGLTPKELIGIGIGAPGPLDREKGILLNPIRLKGWENIDIVRKIKSRFDIRVVLDFAAHAALAGESYFGEGKDYKDIIYINVSNGIGNASIVNNQLIKQGNYDSIILGHMIIELNGKRCDCGRYGCLELYCGEQAVIDYVNELVAHDAKWRETRGLLDKTKKLTIGDVIEYAHNGDTYCIQSLSKAATILGIGLANYINIIQPQLIILGGRMIERSELYFDIAVNTVKANMFNNDKLKFVRNKYVDNAIAVGAAAMVIEDMLADTITNL